MHDARKQLYNNPWESLVTEKLFSPDLPPLHFGHSQFFKVSLTPKPRANKRILSYIITPPVL